MELFTLLWWALLATILVQLLRFIFADGDLSLMWSERFGKKPASLRGQVVWIVGASGGIGEYLAYELARAGCRIVLSARRVEDLERVRKQCLLCGKLAEDDVLVLPLDILKLDKQQEALDTVLQQFGQVDILVNNAGRSQTALIKDSPFENDRLIMELNFLAIVSLTKVVLPHMTQRSQGHIVVTGSLAGIIGVPNSASYSATKFALRGYFEALRTEYYADNISVTMVCPGPVHSGLRQAAFGTKVDEPYGEDIKGGGLKMSTARCAELISVAMANRSSEVWISPQPVLLATYLFQYAPTLAKWLACRLGTKVVTSIRHGSNYTQVDKKHR